MLNASITDVQAEKIAFLLAQFRKGDAKLPLDQLWDIESAEFTAIGFMLKGCRIGHITYEVAKAIGKDHAFVARTTRLTLLAPEIIHTILSGSLQRNIPIENFRKEMPIRREDQKKLFGIE